MPRGTARPHFYHKSLFYRPAIQLNLACGTTMSGQSAHRNSLRRLQWMMAASLALPIALFAIASAISYASTRDIADREIERTLDVAHEHALKAFETIDRSLAELTEVVRGPSDATIRSREQSLHLRLKRLSDSLPQLKSTWIF